MYRVYPRVAVAAVAVYTVHKQTRHAVLVVALLSKKFLKICLHLSFTYTFRFHVYIFNIMIHLSLKYIR